LNGSTPVSRGKLSPADNGSNAKARLGGRNGYEAGLGEEWSKRVASWAMHGQMPQDYTVVPGSTEIGYDIRGDEAVLVARRAVEVDFGDGYKKRYWVMNQISE